MITRQRGAGRLASLDGLRGLAALVVVVHHCLLVVPALYDGSREDAAGSAWFVHSPLHVLWAGGEAVWVFFVLSGLVLTRTVLGRGDREWAAYYPARMARLYLPVAGAVLFSVVVAVLVPRQFEAEASPWLLLHQDPISLTGIGLNLALVAGTDLGLNSVLWSLQWEVVFSLLLPAYVWIVTRVNGWLLVLLCVAAVTAGEFTYPGATGHLQSTLRGAVLYLPIFMVGCVIGRHLPAIQRRFERVNTGRGAPIAWLVSLVLAAVALTAQWSFGEGLYTQGTQLLAPVTLLGAASFVLIALGSSRVKAALSSRPAQWLGAVSFSMYLVHEPIVVSVAALLPTPARSLTIALALPVSLVVGWLFFRICEGPSHRFAQWVGRRFRTAHGTRRPTTTS